VSALTGVEEGSRVARLQSFFSTVLSGIFGQGEEEMATHNQNVAAAPQHQQQQNRVLGGGVPAAGKQKAAMAGRPETKPRRGVLRDIGNIGNLRVAEGKKQLQEPVNAHRPVTRNFGAQLIKKAQEKAKVPSLFLLPSPSILKR